ncbi:methyl-accepting chemotaxis protein [Ectothiorhodospira marina]|uniref:Twitching motility protein PilJ n=1 Tax=Ectothiorhodospira marina TaxID=1396821 RepID=A0A1H7QPQ8_9GAMM|nr:methyl-accepting chemotaxis protein [Ectothiorhodospira marina]SEL49267.1 twitching motility protein PilJ [Ectothiorhodospira marina]
MKSPSSDGAAKMGISRGMAVLTGIVVLLMLLTVSAFVYYTMQVGNSRDYAAVAADQRLWVQRLESRIPMAAAGEDAAFVELRRHRDRLDASLTRLRDGDADITPVSGALSGPLGDLRDAWDTFRPPLNELLDARATRADASERARRAAPVLAQLRDSAQTLAGDLTEAGAQPERVYLAARIAMGSRDLERDLLLVEMGEGFPGSAQRLEQGLQRVEADVNRLQAFALPEDEPLPAMGAQVSQVQAHLDSLRPDLQALAGLSSSLARVSTSADQASAAASELLAAVGGFQEAVERQAAGLGKWVIAGYLLAALTVMTIGLLAYLFYQDAQRRLAVTTEQNRRNQRAILRLLDEMTNLAEGDLTVHATVTEDITGAIADSVNYAIDALRSLVTTINQTAMQVSTAAVKTQATALRLADASNHQAREIASASSGVTDMADSIEQVSRSAESSAEVAQKSVQIASKGALTVRKTIDGMDTIREQIQETSKRIKRLGESSQEIGDIVSLITDIADQTNILALNAAIQASSAGEAGRGFAVVADEVQRLAERSSNASKQIEALVKTIQADTKEAVISMEQSTSNVVGGAKLAFDAGDALAEIEGVSHQLADLIANISKAARQQSEVAQNISNTMNVIQEITMQTSDGTNETAVSIGNLANLASELRKSVSGFKLPESEQLETVIIDPAGERQGDKPGQSGEGQP